MQPSEPFEERTLVLLRHARAEASGPGDHGRPLTASGRVAAADVGSWLSSQGVVPDVALVSDAQRTQETWAEAAEAASWQVEPTLTAALYAAGPDTVLDLVEEVPDEVRTVVVVGHNPTIAYLAGMLDDGLGESAASAALVTGGYAPGTVTVFTLQGTWTQLRGNGATLRSLHVGA